ncbi:MAG TPA: cellulase family glycosylhydrolase [Solirubrobacteraceae bacterium]|nr:cellulase family glycosylhydrolase [Solirubrobacteraceae bacterium]
MKPRLLLLAPLAALATLLPAPVANAAQGMEIGLQDDDVFVGQKGLAQAKAYAYAAQLGVSRLRINVSWDQAVGKSAHDTAAPDPIPYDWTKYDKAIDAAAANGMHVQLNLMGQSPAWATHDRKVGPNRPDPRLFTQFVQDAATHFKGRVDRYAIWNEPNWGGWLSPRAQSPRLYRQLYQNAYRNIRAIDPQAKVLIGELQPIGRRKKSTPPMQWLRSLTCSKKDWSAASKCSRLVADGFSLHPYTLDYSPQFPGLGPDDITTGSLGRLSGVLKKLAKRRALSDPSGNALELYLSEYGFFARGKRAFPEDMRSGYEVGGFQIAAADPHVREMIQFQLASPPLYEQFDTSLLMAGTQAPSATFNALAGWAQQALAAGQVQQPAPFALPPAPTS